MNDALEQRHDAYTTQPDEIAALVARVTSDPIADQRRIVGGIDNEVHRVTLANGGTFVVHIRRHGELPFGDITWALTRAANAGVPVPEVLLCAHTFIDGAERDVMIQRELPGSSLQELLPGLTDNQRRSCYVQAGAALAALHGVPVDGFGMRRHGVWDFPSWESMMSRLQPGSTEQRTMLHAGLTELEIMRLRTALDRLHVHFPCPQPSLLHGDFGPAHLFFDRTLTLSGILDFGQFQGGSPIVDFDLLLPHILEANDPAWFEYLREGYGPTPIWTTFNEHRLLYVLNEHITYFSYHMSIEDTTTIARLVPRVRELLDRLDAYL